MNTNPITDQITGTLRNMRRLVSTQGLTSEADELWRHALSLYKARRETDHTTPVMPLDSMHVTRPFSDEAWVVGQCHDCWGINQHEPGCPRGLPAFLRRQAD